MKGSHERRLVLKDPDFGSQLLAWYDVHARDLPWRKNRDPYRVWVSEIMLQQTRVAAVIEYYQEFIRRFPTVQKLAAAQEASVLAAWCFCSLCSILILLFRSCKGLPASSKRMSRRVPHECQPSTRDWNISVDAFHPTPRQPVRTCHTSA